MSKFKRALKATTGFLNDIVPNELKPVVQIGLALIPGVGPALSAAYTAADAYGGGDSLGKALGKGATSFAISQAAGAASKALGISSAGNDLTDALGMTKSDGILGLGSGTSSGAASALGLSSTAAASPAVSALDEALKTAPSTGITAAASSNVDKVAGAAGSLFSFDNVGKGLALAGGVASAASALAAPKASTAMPNTSTGGVDTSTKLADDAASAAEEEQRRKRRGGSSNVYTSPLGIIDNGKSAASVLLG